MNDYQQRDLAHIWHPCSQMKDYESLPPLLWITQKGPGSMMKGEGLS